MRLLSFARAARLGAIAIALVLGKGVVACSSTGDSPVVSPAGEGGSDSGLGSDAAVTATDSGAGDTSIPTEAAVDAGPLSPCPGAKFHGCATVSVPRDYDDPTGEKIDIAIAVSYAEPAQRIGTLIINFGGPGTATIDPFLKSFYPLLAGDQNNLAVYHAFDIVAVDLRGTGRSSPTVSCLTPSMEGPLLDAPIDPKTDLEWTKLFDADGLVAPSCETKNPHELLALMDTATHARDLDAVRQFLGEDKISYIGYSYGTFLGAMYATMFPTHLRAAVLDSPVMATPDHRDVWRASAPAIDDSLDQFFEWCAGSASCAFGPSTGRTKATIAAAFDALAVQLDATPLTTPSRPLTGAALRLVPITYLYSPKDQWPQFGTDLAAAANGNGSALRANVDAFLYAGAVGDNAFSAFLTICGLDTPLPAGFSRADLRAFVEGELKTAAPRSGYLTGLSELGLFLGWPETPAHAIPAISAPTAPPLLITATRHDPAAAYSNAAKMQTALNNGSHVVTYEGSGHANLSSIQCLAGMAKTYLEDPTKPPSATSCAAVPF